jgi:hypothetical protein
VIYTWTSWKTFPDPRAGDALQAPIGSGVYEVRHSLSGRVVAFGWASSVARTLSELRVNRRTVKGITGIFPTQSSVPRALDLEYRTCAASSRSEARDVARRLLGLKQLAWQSRLTNALSWQRAR